MLGVQRASFTGIGPIKQVRTMGGSGHSAVRNICIECGSLLFGTPESAPDLVTIYAGTLDDSAAFVPEAALFVSQRPPWAALELSLVEHQRMPPPPDE
ncbi:GFA family protein [Lysobacter auxotrophicus]|uniref:GFA family protein n=1 Tax=Lysobacter auxotrophicus TaxID=2992573 RepID=A0ABM8DDH0_9GAMM|nr:GFA family protein [Lysobacter auxotrophicus]BDU16650.1 GFA family protein [Lysobacter auxotrophicus]